MLTSGTRTPLDRPDDADITATSAVPKEEAPEDKAERARVEKVLLTARKQTRTAFTAWSHFRENAKKDAKFHAGTWGDDVTFQWPAEIAQQRRAQGRACITVNRAPGFVRLVTNQARQANLRILVKPVDDDGDVELAEVIQGLIRNVETQSFADRAYAKASEKQGEQGLGFFRLITEWVPGKTFRQRIRIKREPNPLAIVVDPAAQEADFSDAEFAFKFTAVDREKYKELYDLDPPDAASLDADDDTAVVGDWFPNGKIGIAEYFNRETRGRQRIAQLENGDIINYPTPAQIADAEEGKKLLLAGSDVTVIDKGTRERHVVTSRPLLIKQDRTVPKKVIVWRTIDATHVLEESVWPADAQPFIPVMGRELEIDGERDFRGVIRDSKGVAQTYNVLTTGLVEAVGLGTKAPVVGFRGQFGEPDTPQRKAWETANTQPHPFLEVDPLTIDGKLSAQLPQAVRFEPPIEGTVVGIRQTDEDYKSTAGFRDASLAERGPQESGKAILARQRQDELGSSDYLDNLRFALAAAGRQLIQLFRVVYDEPTVVRITGKGDKPKKVMVFSGASKDPRNEEFLQEDPATGQATPFQLPHGVSEIYDLSVGEFDVEVSAGPDPGSRRQEELQFMGELVKAIPPQFMVNFLDLLFGLIDSSKGQQMSERAKMLLPKHLREADEEGGAPDIPPEMQQQFEQLAEQHKAAIETIRGLEEAARTKSIELQSKEKIELMRLYRDLVKLLVQERSTDDRLVLEESIARLDRVLDVEQGTINRADSRAAALTAAAGVAAPASAAVSPGPVSPGPVGTGV